MRCISLAAPRTTGYRCDPFLSWMFSEYMHIIKVYKYYRKFVGEEDDGVGTMMGDGDTMRGCTIYSRTISGLVTKLPNSDSGFWFMASSLSN